MTNELTISTDSSAMSQLRERLSTITQNYAQQSSNEFVLYITRNKRGDYSLGQDKMPLDNNDLWVLDIINTEHGYVAWTDNGGAPVGEIMRKVSEPLVRKEELQAIKYKSIKENVEKTADWRAAYTLRVICVTGNYIGTRAAYTVSNISGTREASAILAATASRLGSNNEQFLPAFYFATEFYKHKTWGETAAIKFPVKQWLTPKEFNALLQKDTPNPMPTPMPTPAAQIEAPPLRALVRQR